MTAADDAPDVATGDTSRPNGPRLILTCGVPFAGKSTLARDLARRFGHAHVEIDAINRERFGEEAGRRLSRGEWAAAYRERYRRLLVLLRAGRSAVYDATNFRRLQRDHVRRVAAPFSPRTTIVWVAPQRRQEMVGRRPDGGAARGRWARPAAYPRPPTTKRPGRPRLETAWPPPHL